MTYLTLTLKKSNKNKEYTIWQMVDMVITPMCGFFKYYYYNNVPFQFNYMHLIVLRLPLVENADPALPC